MKKLSTKTSGLANASTEARLAELNKPVRPIEPIKWCTLGEMMNGTGLKSAK